MVLKPAFEVALAQAAVGDEPKAERLRRVGRLLGRARGADLILLPELWNVGAFACDRYAEDSETRTGPTVSLMRDKARELKAHIMMGSFVERSKAGLHNTALLIDPQGRIAAAYRKMHLFGFQSGESRLLKAGKDIGMAGPFGLSICFDLRFPELYRRQLDRGAEMFLIPAAWPHPRAEHWRVLSRARAIENQAFLAAVNCAGGHRGQRFCGRSVILDPAGKALAEAGEEETVLRARVDLRLVEKARAAFPAVRSRVLV